MNNFFFGNKLAFDKLIDKYRNNIIYFINNFVKDINIAEDLAQDVFVYVLVNKKEYDFKYSMKTYLYTIAKSRALNYLKRNNKLIQLEENKNYFIESNYSNEIENEIFLNETKVQLYKAIKKLPKLQEKAIYLADIEGFSYKEICKILGKTLPQIKMTIYRARKNLKTILRKEDF